MNMQTSASMEAAPALAATCNSSLRCVDPATIDGHQINSLLLDLAKINKNSVISLPKHTDPGVILVVVSPTQSILFTPDGGIELPNGSFNKGTVHGLPITLVNQGTFDDIECYQVVKVFDTEYKPITLTPLSIRDRFDRLNYMRDRLRPRPRPRPRPEPCANPKPSIWDGTVELQ